MSGDCFLLLLNRILLWYDYTTFCLYQLVDIWLFPVFTSKWIILFLRFTCMSFFGHIFFLGRLLGMGSQYHGKFTFDFLGNWLTAFLSVASFHTLTSNVWEFHVLLITIACYCRVFFFFIVAILVGILLWYQFSFFLATNDIEHLFICLSDCLFCPNLPYACLWSCLCLCRTHYLTLSFFLLSSCLEASCKGSLILKPCLTSSCPSQFSVISLCFVPLEHCD